MVKVATPRRSATPPVRNQAVHPNLRSIAHRTYKPQRNRTYTRLSVYDAHMSVRIDIRVPEDVLKRIDAEAMERAMTRTALLIERWDRSSPKLRAQAATAEEVVSERIKATHTALEDAAPRIPPCHHGRAKVLRLKNCPDCGEKVQ